MRKDIAALKRAIKDLHGLGAKHTRSEPVKEVFRGQTVWNGTVEVFEVKGHPKAKRCYAWAHLDGDQDQETRYVAVLELPPVDSAVAAVRAAIVSQHKRAGH